MENLDSLQTGVSNSADVLLALGEPRGAGMSKLSVDLKPRNIWFYEFLESDGTEVNFEMLTVLMLDDIYDGHLWFSSFYEYESEQVSSPFFGPQTKIEGGNFPAIETLEEKFERGISPEEEVITALGQPAGIGTAVMPPDHIDTDVLFYENIKVIGQEYMPTLDETYLELDIDQRILLVFIKKGRFDGFMWFMNKLPTEALPEMELLLPAEGLLR